ncbi:stage IV sporulation protein A [Anaerovorax odorimutans]|uniref:Stage IV sporulation protein A n=1 Tax=Anaerovorax odorimutans TaxID=109327 RepID=A0ABT1RKP5_9FIRM|nr:stage IV sporulation protein A [Anaerovorax odorimutans]MCQ4635531.1 stage IV sporulation protein A [Anaerovorax odorimutans]
MENLNIYESIAKRSQGDIYIGVVGPVRVGKSTFIKRFMDLLVVPNMKNIYAKERLLDELPQSGSGRTITTTEPKFVPAEAASLKMPGNMNCRVRLVDCVGYLVPEALGHSEDGKARMVNTPWDEEKIPFEEAAEKGTRKVIEEHSTIGIAVTTDGTTSDIPRKNYEEAEEKVIRQLKELKKPFVVVVNSTEPKAAAAQSLAQELQEKHKVPVMAVNCMRMSSEELNQIVEKVLYQFPISEISFELPGFMEGLETDHWIKSSVIESIRGWSDTFETAEDIQKTVDSLADGQIIRAARVADMDLGSGQVVIDVQMADGLFYKVIEELMDEKVENDYEFFRLLREFAEAKKSYDKLKGAMEQVEATGYGIVQPKLTEMVLGEPEVFKQGNKCGVRLTAKAPSLHIIRTDITTEVAPVVGSEQQTEDLVKHLLTEFETQPEKIWETNIFGKTLYDMVAEQMQSKLAGVPENIRVKVQKSLQKICDEGKEYFICIVI